MARNTKFLTVPNDLFKARLDQIVDLGHPLARLAATIDWRFLEERFGAVYTDKPGQPPLPQDPGRRGLAQGLRRAAVAGLPRCATSARTVSVVLRPRL